MQTSPVTHAAHKQRASFDATAKARAELLPEDLAPINLDIPSACTTVYGALDRLKMLREQIIGTWKEFDIEAFDAIETYAEALAAAHFLYTSSSAPAEELPALTARAGTLRDLFLSDVQTLVKRGVFEAKVLGDIKGGTGYMNVISDIGTVSALLQSHWVGIQGKISITADELAEAEELTDRIMRAYGQRTNEPAKVTAAADERTRAYTLLVNAYDEARRAATYLRWNSEDVDQWVPSLWKGRGGRGKTANADTTQPVVPTNDAAPAPVVPVVVPTPAAPQAGGTMGGSPFGGN